MPFKFEGPKRIRQAERGLADLATTVDTVISIPNDRLMKFAPKGTSFLEAFKLADDVLRQAVQGISEIMLTPGVINRDFSDIKAIMSGMGHAMMGTATAKGDNAAVEAARAAISSPLLEENGVEGARGLLINVAGSSALTLDQFADACSLIFEATKNEEVHMSYGLVHDEDLGDEVKVTVIATGFARESSIPLSPPRVERAAPVPAPISVPYFESETVDVHIEVMESFHPAAPPALDPVPPAPAPAPAPKADADPFDDIDTPAFLHMFRASGQASFEETPGFSRVIAAQDLGLGTAGLGGRVAAKLDRIVRAGAYRPVTGPGHRTVFRRAKKNSVWDCWMVGHGNRVCAPQAILALGPVFPAIVGTISANSGAGE